MIATAGADRLQEGMRKAFGKPIGVAARVDIGTTVLELHVKTPDLALGKKALHAAKAKLPMLTQIEVVELTPDIKAAAAAEGEEEEETPMEAEEEAVAA